MFLQAAFYQMSNLLLIYSRLSKMGLIVYVEIIP